MRGWLGAAGAGRQCAPRRSYGGIGRPLNVYSQGHET